MLDKVLSCLKDEIGIDGIQGSNISTVWKHVQDILNSIVQESNVAIVPVIDDRYKGYIWEYIKTMEDITFYIKHDAPVPKQKTKKKEKKSARSSNKRKAANESDDDYGGGESSSSEEEDEEEDELEDEEEDEQVKKKAPGRKKNENIEREPKKSNESITIPDQNLDNFEQVDVSGLTFAEMNASFGDRLHIIASQKIQDQQLYYSLPPDCSLSSNVSLFLREILKCRAAGFYQASLTKHFNLDSRSTGHYCKVLEEKGAITRQRVTVKGFYTNICTHIRYKHSADNGNTIHESDSAPYNMNTRGEYITVKDICATIIELAKDANEKTIMARDVLYALGFESNKNAVKKWFNRCIHDLYESGYIKKLKTQVNGHGPMMRCIQLLKDSMDDGPKDINVTEKIDYPMIVEPISGRRAPSKGVYIDLSLSRQVFLNIEDSHETGITQKGMAVALNSVNNRLLYRYLELLSAKTITNYERFYICRHIEFEKRVRRYRYFSLKTYKRLNENDDNYEYPPLPESEFDETKLFELNSNFDFEHKRKAYLAVLKNSFREPSGTGLRNRSTGKAVGRPSKKSKQNEQGETATTTKKTKRKTAARVTTTTQNEATVPGEAANETQIDVAAVASPPPTEDTAMEEPESSTAGLSNEPEVNSSAEPTIPSKVPTPCKSSHPKSSALKEQFLSQESITSSQDSTTDGESSSSKRSAFGVMMSSSRTTSSSRNKAPSLPTQDDRKETVSMIKIPPSTLMKPKRPACSKIAAEEAEATAAEETATIIATEELEEEEIRVSNKRRKTTQPTKGRKKSKNIDDPAEASSSQSSDSQPKKKSLFDYFGKSKSNPPVNKENTPSIVEETEPMETDSTVNKEQEENGDNEEKEEKGKKPVKTRRERPFTQSVFTNVERFQPPKPVNRYMELRKKTIMTILETEAAFVSNKACMEVFVKVYNQLSTVKATHTPQKRTILNSAEELEKEGLVHLKMKPVCVYGGKTIEYFIVVPKSMDLEGEEFKKIYNDIGFDKSIHGVVPQFEKIQRFDAPVERLDDRLEKIKKDLEEKRKTRSARQTDAIEYNIDRYASNAKSITKVEKNYTSPLGSEWRLRLEQSGFISAKMYRARALHKHIFNIWLEQGDILHEDSTIIPAVDIIGKMTAHFYLQVIGIRNMPLAVKEFLCDLKNANMALEDFPEDIASTIFSGVSKMRQFLRMLLSILTFLGLIEPEKNDANMIHTAYRIIKTVDLYDIRYKKEFVNVKQYTITDEESFNMYWDALKYLVTLRHELVKEHLAPPVKIGYDQANFTSIFASRSWTTSYHYTPEQLDLLNYYVDREKFKTPLSNLNHCAEISQIAGLSVESVHSFYEKLQKRLDYQLERKTTKEIQSTSGIQIRRRHRFNGNFARTGIVRKGNIVTTRYCSTAKQGATEDQDILTVEGDTINYDQLKKYRGKRVLWSDQEDEILMYSYIVMRGRLSANRDFRWSPATRLLPNRTNNSCRNRFDKMIMKSRHRERVIAYERLWARFYKEGIQRGDIVDERPDDPINFDIITFMEYFIIRLNETHNISNFELPSTLEEMKNYFTIERVSFDKKSDYAEYFLYYSTQMRRKTDLLRTALCSRANRDNEVDSPLGAFEAESIFEQRQKKLIRTLYLMSMYSPDETYSAIDSYVLITQFPKVLRESVFSKMREDGTLIIAKRERSIPTSTYTLSSKFIQCMIDKYPKSLFCEARDFKNHLDHSKKITFDPDAVVGGTMACLLSLISQNRLTITIQDHEEQMQRFEYTNSRSRNLKVEMIHFDINLAMNNSPSLGRPVLTFAPEDQNALITVSKDTIDANFSHLISSQLPQHQHTVSHSIVKFLREKGATGASTYQIKLHLSETVSDKDLLDCLEALEKLSIINSVGIDAERYILSVSQFIDSWTIKMKRDIPNSTEKLEAIIKPTIWTNVQGYVTPVVLEECTRRVFGLIMRQPGITETVISRTLNELLTRKEIRMILKQLVEKNVLRVFRVSFAKTPEKSSLFSQPRSKIRTKQNIIAECTESSYWPFPDSYSAIM
ncbi:hypothetical protein K501DRAFT_334165 [Backusella circina FSU 941]|nr:hypothetical protein K501DRAFT_334165 [Backusella circina FSU 941]